MQAITSFNSKLVKSCRRLLRLLKVSYKRRISIMAFRLRNLRKFGSKKPPRKRRLSGYLMSVFRRSSEDMEGLGELMSMASERDWTTPYPSPRTPAYVKLVRGRRRREDASVVMEDDNVEESCRSFEKYLVGMIVDEGKVGDLVDVEELLYCWNDLKSPVFVDLVCRFYGELCKDLFMGTECDDSV